MGLGFVIFVHELGHFLVAKACGVKCEKFYVGFDAFDIRIGDTVLIPKSLLKWQWGETEYGIGIIPLGGYVKMLGQDDNPGNMEKEIQRSIKEGDEAEVSKEDVASGLVDRTRMDPRSFLSKSVIQRMAIISAGVVFNIIFAIIMAAIAFKSGVNFDPPNVGNVSPGGPAWQQNLGGIEVVRINDKKKEDYLPFIDLIQEVAINGDNQPIEIEFRRHDAASDSKQTQTVEVTPSKDVDPSSGFALIGITPGSTNVIADEDPFLEGFMAAGADPPIKGGDRIVKINDMDITGGYDLRMALTQTMGQPITMTLQREVKPADPEKNIEADYQTLTTTVDPTPRREIGMFMKWGPVVAVQENSPAEAAGIKPGDVVVSVDGKPRRDLMMLDYRITERLRENEEPMEVTLIRDAEKMTVSVQPRMPRVIPSGRGEMPVGVDSLGLAIKLTREVEHLKLNSPAEDAGILLEDKLVSIEFLLSEKQKNDPKYASLVKSPVTDLVDDKAAWNSLHATIQSLPAGSKFKLVFDRGGKEFACELNSRVSADAYQVARGIHLNMEKDFYKSDSWASSFSLGARQTWKEGKRVWSFLTKMVRGELSPTNLGGPGTIAAVATSEASAGTSRLLLFLTMLSANLAIINFLPIPVLDGGHMMFLAYEGLFRRPVTERVQIALTYLGLFFILGLMGFVLFLDAFRLSGWF